MHLDDETLQRVLHDELDPDVVPRVRDHLAACPACARRLEDAEREERRVFSLLESLDHEPPAGDPEVILGAASGRERWRSLAAAAVAFLIVAAGLAYAIPGSAVREWVRSALLGDRPAAVSETPAAADEPTAGVSIDPGDSLDVVFGSPQETGTIHVSSSPAGELLLQILGQPPGIRVESHRLRIDNAGSTASYRIEIPASAPRVGVYVGSRRVLVKVGLTVRAEAERDSTGGYVIPLAP